MKNKNKEDARFWFRHELKYHRKEYEDECGELNYTKLAEDCADSLDLYEDHEEYVIPEWVFTMVIDVADTMMPRTIKNY